MSSHFTGSQTPWPSCTSQSSGLRLLLQSLVGGAGEAGEEFKLPKCFRKHLNRASLFPQQLASSKGCSPNFFRSVTESDTFYNLCVCYACVCCIMLLYVVCVVDDVCVIC